MVTVFAVIGLWVLGATFMCFTCMTIGMIASIPIPMLAIKRRPAVGIRFLFTYIILAGVFAAIVWGSMEMRDWVLESARITSKAAFWVGIVIPGLPCIKFISACTAIAHRQVFNEPS